MNMEAFGSELEKLNATNAPKEEDAKNAEGADAKNAEGADAKKAEGADAKNAEGADVKNAPAPAKSAASQNQAATAIAIAAVSSAQAAQASEPQHVKFVSPDNETPPPPPPPPPQEVIAINKLYEKYKDKKQKIKQIRDLRKYFDTGLKKLVPLLLDIYTKSFKSYNESNRSNPENNYIRTQEYKTTKEKLEKELNTFKKKNYKYIKDKTSACNEVISEFSPSYFTYGEKKDLAKKICTLFEKYAHIMEKFNEAHIYFKDHTDMKPVIGAIIWGATKEDIETSFENSINFLTKFTTELEKEEKYTVQLEQQFQQTSN